MEVTEFYRCMTCGKSYEMHEFLQKLHAKCRCGCGRFMPTILSKWEVLCYLLTHPSVVWDTAKYKFRGE